MANYMFVRALRAHLWTLVVFVVTLSLYLTTLTGVHTFDALSYILDVQRKPLVELFHPHHLAYGPLGWAVYHGAEVIGYRGNANVPLQVLNTVAGAAGAALFFAVLHRVFGRTDLALAGAALLALSYAYWYYAIEVEVYTLAALFLIACLGQFAQLNKHTSSYGFLLLGVLQGLAVLFHQTNVLLCVPVVTYALGFVRQIGGWKQLVWRALLPYAAALSLTVGLPYGAAVWLSDLTDWARLRSWLLSYAETGWWGGPITSDKWSDLGEGLSLTIADSNGALIAGLFIAFAVIGTIAALVRFRRLGAYAKMPTVVWMAPVCLVWLLTYGAFFLWWEPDNIEFWIASLPPAILLLLMALWAVPGRLASLAVGATLVLTCTMGWINGEAIWLRGNPERDLQRKIVTALVESSGPDDLLLIPDGLQELYLPYYEGRFAYASLNQLFFDHGPGWPTVCTALRGRIDAALQAGAAVIVADEVLHPPELLRRRHRISAEDVSNCLADYLPAMAPLAMPSPQPNARRLPGANERAAQGWSFDTFSWGWQASNVTEKGVNDSWRFIPAADPALLSPRLSLDAARFKMLEVRLASDTTSGEAQLFWSGPDGQLNEARSLRWALRPGSEQTYRLDLAAAPGWQGTITRLRLDPVGVGDGGTMRLRSIRLVP